MSEFSVPTMYSSVCDGVVFGVYDAALDEAGCAEAHILVGDSTEPFAVKRYYGYPFFDVDVTPYARMMMSLRPSVGSVELRNDFERTAIMSVRVGDEQSEKVIISAAAQRPPLNTLLSEMDERVIAQGEYDEIAFITDQADIWSEVTVRESTGRSYSWRSAVFSPNGRVTTYGVSATRVVVQAKARGGIDPDKVTDFDISILLGAENPIVVHYTLVPPRVGTRVMWLNRFGSFESFTFSGAINRSLKVERSASNVSPVTSAEYHVGVVSGVQPSHVVEWLSEIYTSPSVWIVDDTLATECRVLNPEVKLYDRDLPTSLGVTLAYECEPLAQRV